MGVNFNSQTSQLLPYSLPTEAMFLVIQSNRYMSKLSCTGFIFVCESFFVPAPFNLKPRVKIEAKGALAMPIYVTLPRSHFRQFHSYFPTAILNAASIGSE